MSSVPPINITPPSYHPLRVADRLMKRSDALEHCAEKLNNASEKLANAGLEGASDKTAKWADRVQTRSDRFVEIAKEIESHKIVIEPPNQGEEESPLKIDVVA